MAKIFWYKVADTRTRSILCLIHVKKYYLFSGTKLIITQSLRSEISNLIYSHRKTKSEINYENFLLVDLNGRITVIYEKTHAIPGNG